jgi:hypothetical protein
MRDAAELHVVVFSDEDDQSPEPVDFYVGQLEDAAGSAGMTVHAIVGDLPEGCASGVTAADPSTRYIEAVELTGGFEDSICAQSYEGILEKVGLDVAGLNDTFLLERLPEEATLQVWVDGVLIPQRDEDGWTYAVGDNALVFTGRAIPRPGMEVFVEYELLAGSD